MKVKVGEDRATIDMSNYVRNLVIEGHVKPDHMKFDHRTLEVKRQRLPIQH